MNALNEYIKLFYFLLRPKTIFVRRISGAVGDNILLSAILPGLKEKYPDHKIIVETPKPELFEHNPLADWCTTRHFKTTKKFIKPKYRIFPETKASIIEQILSYIPEKKYRTPEIFLTESEIRAAEKEFPFKYIAVAPTGKTKFAANRKEWGIENFQKVRDLFPDVKFVQIGIPSEPLMKNVTDARNFSLRHTAAILKNSLFFFGLEGGFMHLNKAAGNTSVIIFGGYIKPELSGYPDDINISTDPECSPCYTSESKHSECGSMICMKSITVEHAAEAVERKLNNILNKGELK